MGTTVLDELGFYALAGHAESARDLIDEVQQGEAMGLGTAFISERYNKKEAATLSGAAGAVTERIRIETAATNHNTRHPMVTAGFARTMQSLTGGRFVLGLGRGIRPLQDAYGIDHITTAQMEDFVGLMRRLFRGEVVMGHDGPAGSYPILHLSGRARRVPAHEPRGLRPQLPRARRALLRRGGPAHVLHRRDRRRAVRARSSPPPSRPAAIPTSVKVWSCFATIGDHIAEPLRLKKSVGRLATYLQGYGDLLVGRTAGTRRCSSASEPTTSSAASPGASTRWRRPSSSNTSPT